MAEMVFPSATPSKGNRATGNMAVAARGMASVTHQMAISNATAETRLRSAARTSKDFNSDDASVWITDDVSGVRLRLPRLNPAYDAEFPSGWARPSMRSNGVR